MPRKKKIDSAKLIKDVESGVPSTVIMEKYGIKTSAQLKARYLDALVEKGAASAIKSSRGRGAAKETDDKNIKVNKRGSLIIPRSLVEEMGFKVGQEFNVRKTKAGLSLRQQ